MRHCNHLMVFCFTAVISSCGIGASNSKKKKVVKPAYQWEQTHKSLALRNGDGRIIWKLNFDKEQDKPYFHPLRTPKGHQLTLERPKDHPWHRGLWFSWKDINGVNYWEEDPKKGVAVGRSIIQSVNIEKFSDFSAKIILDISYQENGLPVIEELRTLQISSPIKKDVYTIQWDQTFETLKDVRLYLERPAKHGGVRWGGYAGLSFRGSDSLSDHEFTSSSGWVNTEDITGYGEKERWMDLTAKVLGSEEYAGLTIYDYPSNPRFPAPFYVWFAKGKHTFFTPSILFDGPMNFKRGDTFSLKYLVLVHDGKKSKRQLILYENL